MKNKVSLLVLAAFLATALTAFAEPTRTWSQGNPTNDEQYALEVINRVRKDPVAAADFYIGLSDPTLKAAIAGVSTRDSANNPIQGAAALKALTAQQVSSYVSTDPITRTAPPKPPLVLYPLFSATAAARLDAKTNEVASFLFASATKAQSLSGTNYPIDSPALSGPNATGGSATTLAGGINSTGQFSTGAVQYVTGMFPTSTGFATIRESFAGNGANTLALWLDDSVTQTRVGQGPGFTISRGETRMTGIKVSDVRSNGWKVLSVFQTDQEALSANDLPYGVANTVFVTGVVYQDLNRDGEYSPGEGIAGVRVTLSTGDWYAVTSASGGYAIPVPRGSGVYNVSAISTDGTLDSANVATVNSDSVKIDFVTQPARPAQIRVGNSDGDNQLINLSTRGVAAKGADAMIAGFVITGTAPKTILIRGVANSLLSFGLPGVLRQPILTLYDSQSHVIQQVSVYNTYTNKTGATLTGPSETGVSDSVRVRPELANAFRQVGAFDLTLPFWADRNVLVEGSRYYAQGDVAIIATLQPGLYSVAIAPDPNTADPSATLHPAPENTSGDSGIVLLEIYDMNPGNGSRFVNLSTRGRIETGARQMIVGFVITGTGHKQLLVRGIGPALKGFGLPTALDDSAVTLYNSKSEPILDNDDWARSTWADQTVDVSTAVGAFAIPASSPDGIILTRLAAPGLYSVAIRSASGSPGIGLAEIYEVP